MLLDCHSHHIRAVSLMRWPYSFFVSMLVPAPERAVGYFRNQKPIFFRL